MHNRYANFKIVRIDKYHQLNPEAFLLVLLEQNNQQL